MPNCLRTPIVRLALVATSLLSSAGWASGPASRIANVATVANTPVPHSVSPRAKLAEDLGPAPADHLLPAITVNFARSSAQQAALTQLLSDQANPSSPRYRQWLTPAQFKVQFGMSDADIAKTTAWLRSQGFTVTTQSLTNTYVVVSGTVSQAEKAFHVSLRSVSVQGESHIANVTDPQLPAAIANVVSGITGLSDILPKPRAILRKVPRPQLTDAGPPVAHYITPADYNTIYDLAPLGAAAINGTGATIAVMGQTSISLSDVAAFRTAAGLSANAPSVQYNPTSLGVSTNDLAEAQLDVEWSGAIAPSAAIEYVAFGSAQGGAFGALVNSIANTTALAPVISISYGECEPAFAQADIYSYDQYFQQANAQGQTIIGPGGDSGATDCDYQSTVATDGLAVDFPGSSPHATSIGGTMFNEGSGSYWSSSNGTGGGSALSYIPEVVWNESAGSSELSAGGGGRSIYFTKPSWQVGSGVPADSVRDVPDIALDAGVDNDGFLICVQGSCTNGFADASGNYSIVGGTSVGVPSFSGVLALIEQKISRTGGLGNINPTLYGLAATSAASVYHDIVAGNNASTCALGSPDCSSSTRNAGYSAAAGYDLATGWGSVDGNNLAGQWASAVPTGVTTATGSNLSVTNVSLANGTTSCGISSTALTFAVSVAGSGNTISNTAGSTAVPTGTVQLFVDGVLFPGAATLSNGTATLTLDTTTLVSGSHKIAVAYSGDSTFASSRGNLAPALSPAATSLYVAPSTIDVVSPTSPDFSLTPCLPTLTVASGSSATVTMTATALNGFSGPVTFSASTDAQLYGYAALSFSASPVTISTTSAGTTVLTVNASYTPSSNVRSASLSSGNGGRGDRSRRVLYGTGAGTAALASLLFFVLPRRRRYVGLLALVISAAAISASGCGSGASTIPASTVPTTKTTGTPSGYYLINVTASGMNSAGTPITHTSSLTVEVQ